MTAAAFVLAAIAWPLLHLGIFVARFGETPPLGELWVFAPTGLLAALVVRTFVRRSESPRQGRAALIGAALATPAGLVGNILGGLAGPIGVTVLGAIPVAAGAAAGWAMTRGR